MWCRASNELSRSMEFYNRREGQGWSLHQRPNFISNLHCYKADRNFQPGEEKALAGAFSVIVKVQSSQMSDSSSSMVRHEHQQHMAGCRAPVCSTLSPNWSFSRGFSPDFLQNFSNEPEHFLTGTDSICTQLEIFIASMMSRDIPRLLLATFLCLGAESSVSRKCL